MKMEKAIQWVKKITLAPLVIVQAGKFTKLAKNVTNTDVSKIAVYGEILQIVKTVYHLILNTLGIVYS